MKKVIPKGLLDEALAYLKDYYHCSPTKQVLERTHTITHEIEFHTGVAWYSLEDLICSILSGSGVKPDATNEDIYAILRLLGWEVSD